MMSNLFSIFDPNTNNMIKLNWLSSLMVLTFLPMNFFFLNSRLIYLFNNFMILIFNEIKIIMKIKFNLLNSLLFSMMMMMILMNNFMGLFPYIFTSSSHMIFSLSMSMPLWIGIMMFGWLKNSQFMIKHLIPQGTPNSLVPFMILIESISNFIRPWTLAIRLTANMIAGHLLVTLMSSSPKTFLMMMIIIILQILLLMLEFSVSIIQSYVFTILSTLYTKETN